jgi:hypothetical protein
MRPELVTVRWRPDYLGQRDFYRDTLAYSPQQRVNDGDTRMTQR